MFCNGDEGRPIRQYLAAGGSGELLTRGTSVLEEDFYWTATSRRECDWGVVAINQLVMAD